MDGGKGGLPPRVETARLVLRLAEPRDVPRVLDFYLRNREHFAPWDPPHPDGFHTVAYWSERVVRLREEERERVSLRFFLFPRSDEAGGPVLGVVSFTRIYALPAPSAQVGYGIDRAHEGTGLMTEALAAALRFVAEHRGIRRVTATYQVDNVRSGRLLERMGFRVEGRLARHLFTNGAWRDHFAVALDLPAT